MILTSAAELNGSTDEKGREFRLINITNKGLEELSSDQPQQ
jgi:hypothetical protein